MVEIVSWVMIFVVNVVVIDASLTEIVTFLVSDKDVTGVALGVVGAAGVVGAVGKGKGLICCSCIQYPNA